MFRVSLKHSTPPPQLFSTPCNHILEQARITGISLFFSFCKSALINSSFIWSMMNNTYKLQFSSQIITRFRWHLASSNGCWEQKLLWFCFFLTTNDFSQFLFISLARVLICNNRWHTKLIQNLETIMIWGQERKVQVFWFISFLFLSCSQSQIISL